MNDAIETVALTAERFAPFGEVLAPRGVPDKWINDGRCGRHHDVARLDFASGRAGISLFDTAPVALPYRLTLLERHPLGSQAFLPMHDCDWLVIAAPDHGGRPGAPVAFLAGARQGVNFARGVWHGVLAPLHHRALFAVIDRIGAGDNLEEYPLPRPVTVHLSTPPAASPPQGETVP